METTKKTKEMDMLNGGLAGKLILFSIPLAFSSILQQLFNSADVAVVGRFAGDRALAAVGSCVDRGIFRRSECSVSKPDRTEAKR